jgi:membrane-associated phospholipid phosphatase
MIVLVALARILLQVHWPSDVLGGIGRGLGCVAAAAALTAASTARRPAAPTSP